ncbi:LEAF RUST 10 DISEASE-RESISTANCE LOCUS RECEPTOR-LIKE PROTEIN KINASE-like 2.7 [Argentina anserina]|uniref:LEAF RUST 10 DISEASE-RESISTANCE LOCUS RECEPTOR-LIKE PROTEIN KINASE-like 2.7 n=1 Tax=Argentina anserina TaxID=57926 RepID=UPI0021765703|nr:LEAF RUST 10 DISEASE-RESISTANCE LOCUS RECEPTOR-LIKE PROTEIN KINASE-like 2.7 [Potentilla anserina]
MNSFVLFESSLIPLFFITSFLTINFQSSVYADTVEYSECSQTITCGSVTSNISYPFWGENRPEYCGKSGFEATCTDDDVPMITMKKIEFRLLDMSNSTNLTTVTVARNDYWDSLCPPNLITTDLDYSLFNYTSGPQDVSFYYGCSLPAEIAPTISGFDFSAITRDCSNGVTVSFLTEKQIAKIPASTNLSTICPNVVSVPVSASASDALDNNQTSTIEAAVKGGFELNVQIVDTGVCKDCVASGGLCGQDTTTRAFICYCQNGTSPNTCDSNSATPDAANSSKGINYIYAFPACQCYLFCSFISITGNQRYDLDE